jgi:hypothetical protein
MHRYSYSAVLSMAHAKLESLKCDLRQHCGALNERKFTPAGHTAGIARRLGWLQHEKRWGLPSLVTRPVRPGCVCTELVVTGQHARLQ